MIAAGAAIAVSVMIVIAVAQRNGDASLPAGTAPDRTRLGASILFQLLLAGGTQPDAALRELRRIGFIAPVTSGIDIANWSERYAQLASPEQRAWLLETAVQLVAIAARPVPLRQYASLLDITFSLGFHTDTLARLRDQYGFDYIDHAKDGRPRSADRAGGAAPLFTRDSSDTVVLLRTLGLEHNASRQMIISAYRRLVSQIHPDRVHTESESVQSQAAARFIEITHAYETLMAIYRD